MKEANWKNVAERLIRNGRGMDDYGFHACRFRSSCFSDIVTRMIRAVQGLPRILNMMVNEMFMGSSSECISIDNYPHQCEKPGIENSRAKPGIPSS
ncbi:hypothetical protein Y032_0092g2603 [Ancylostoma ceylanicum]|uniref:Uncharacterized protein n=1 Tax=Ancylostoma ceylanicum TaxID=53326 RepID=A0A016TL87_9BILA|nr:hypothetical protein Y032_0092g2603 [Ancylostoma ceylanicum]